MIKYDFDAVDGLVQAMVTFDPSAAQHLAATSAFAERLAKAMELEPAIVENCRVGGLLHDIGQFGMDRMILHHTGMLVDAEWNLMMQHPVLGERLLLRIPSLAHLAPIVRGHHERVDGTGYPDALMGSEIPLEARIIAVVDAFHTMTIPLPYRAAFDTDRAMAELLGNRDSQFDANVVDAFAAMMAYRQRRLREA
jgi:HD-GYP domain-containing protein (c-di-GMP phosphodiesterase class II)